MGELDSRRGTCSSRGTRHLLSSSQAVCARQAVECVPSNSLGPHPLQVEKASDIANAERLVFPGVGAFGQAMKILQERGYTQALKDYIQARWGGGAAG